MLIFYFKKISLFKENKCPLIYFRSGINIEFYQLVHLHYSKDYSLIPLKNVNHVPISECTNIQSPAVKHAHFVSKKIWSKQLDSLSYKMGAEGTPLISKPSTRGEKTETFMNSWGSVILHNFDGWRSGNSLSKLQVQLPIA